MRKDDFKLAENLTYLEGYYGEMKNPYLKIILAHDFFNQKHAIECADFAKERKFVYIKAPAAEKYFLIETLGDWREFFYTQEEIAMVEAGGAILESAREIN